MLPSTPCAVAASMVVADLLGRDPRQAGEAVGSALAADGTISVSQLRSALESVGFCTTTVRCTPAELSRAGRPSILFLDGPCTARAGESANAPHCLVGYPRPGKSLRMIDSTLPLPDSLAITFETVRPCWTGVAVLVWDGESEPCIEVGTDWTWPVAVVALVIGLVGGAVLRKRASR